MRNDLRLAFALLLASAQTVTAQTVNGSLEGQVLSQDGTALNGVSISITGSTLIGVRTSATDARGRFIIHALGVGSYRLELKRVGFHPVLIEAVRVRLGETTRLPDLRLIPVAVQLPEMIIDARVPSLDPARTTQAVVLSAHQLDALPLERNFREAMVLAPAAVPSVFGKNGSGDRDEVNIGGATGYENTYFVDGINITSPIRGETSIDLPYNFIQEMEVRTGGSSANEVQAHGGVVNLVTPAGTERLEGKVFGFFSNDALEASARDVVGSYVTGFTFYDIGGSVSGPLMKDRIRFFGAFNENYERRNYTYPFGELASARRQHLFASKLTWRSGERTSGFLSAIGDPSRSEPLAMPLFGSGIPQNEEVLRRKDRADGVGLSARVQHSVSRNLLLEASLSQMTRNEYGEPASAEGKSPVVIDYVSGSLSGGHGLAYAYKTRRRTAKIDVTLNDASHEVRAGIQAEQLYGDIRIDIGRHSAGGTIERTAADVYTWHYASGGSGRGTNFNPALYIQDNWQLSRQVSLNAGVRWSSQLLKAKSSKAVFDQFRIRDGIQPRIGIVYGADPTGNQRVFASYSRAAQQLPVWSFQDFASATESLLVFNHDPRLNPNDGDVVYGFTYGMGTPSDSPLRGQTQDIWTAGYHHRLRQISLSAVATRRQIARVVASGTDTAGASVWGNPGYGAMSHFPRMNRTYDALEITGETEPSQNFWVKASYVLSRNRGNYPGLFSSDWRLGFSNYGPLFISPEQYENASGLLPNDRTHVFKIFGSRRINPALNLGVSAIVASGTPLSEYGAISIPLPFRGFASRRGAAGRTPAVWDLGVRATYSPPLSGKSKFHPRIILDVQHIGSQRKTIDVEQLRYTCLDDNGNQSCANPAYGRVLQYQPPMVARLGASIDFIELR